VLGHREHEGNKQRPEHRPELVQGLMHPERLAVSDLLRRMREHRVPWRIADPLAYPLGDDQRRGRLPVPGQRE
jgi:hypothetical protein